MPFPVHQWMQGWFRLALKASSAAHVHGLAPAWKVKLGRNAKLGREVHSLANVSPLPLKLCEIRSPENWQGMRQDYILRRRQSNGIWSGRWLWLSTDWSDPRGKIKRNEPKIEGQKDVYLKTIGWQGTQTPLQNTIRFLHHWSSWSLINPACRVKPFNRPSYLPKLSCSNGIHNHRLSVTVQLWIQGREHMVNFSKFILNLIFLPQMLHSSNHSLRVLRM